MNDELRDIGMPLTVKKVAKAQRDDYGTFSIIDTRNGNVVRYGVTPRRVAAYCQYYNEEIAIAEKFWADWDKKAPN